MKHRRCSVLTGACLLCYCILSQAAERIISLAPSMTDIVLELGAEARLMGVLDAGERPASLASLPSVGRYGQINIEQIVALRPDLILLWPGAVPPAQREQLQQLGYPIEVLDVHRLDELADGLARVGQVVGVPDEGRRLAVQFREQLTVMRTRYQRLPPVRVFYQVWDKPLYTIGNTQIINDAIQVCGGKNIFADLPQPAPQVGIETVLTRDPDVILAMNQAQLQHWGQWPTLKAVARQHLWAVEDKRLERPSYGMLNAVARLCELLNKAR
ncbi:cobalamin-binding protein [Pseudomonas asuensis]|uniref:Cobalamin-binding protein n=1 Tax=Pseudomonas asuensis TaxID=1825787 RepID=A0ABQ2GJV2_9PSED|nr:cobalamin-binding protein [Pseudomonas asuensis]GGL98941.1 cobalamin-binding protein [Pseudomonas asuensis]